MGGVWGTVGGVWGTVGGGRRLQNTVNAENTCMVGIFEVVMVTAVVIH